MKARRFAAIVGVGLPLALGVPVLAAERSAAADVSSIGAIPMPMPRRTFHRRPPPRRPPIAMEHPSTRVVTATLDDLPLESFPEPLGAPERARFDADPPADLAITPYDASVAKRFPRTHEGMQVRVEVRAPGLHGVYAARSEATRTGEMDVYCADGYSTWPLRWESFRIDEAGGATLSIADGWFDQRACRASVERRTELHPRVLAFDGAEPIAFASRVAGGFLLFFPGRSGDVAADAGTAEPPTVVRGAVTRVFLPFEPGTAAAVLVAEPRFSTQASLAVARGVELSPAGPVERDDRIVGVDLVQAVSEEAPSAIVRLTDDRQEDDPLAAR